MNTFMLTNIDFYIKRRQIFVKKNVNLVIQAFSLSQRFWRDEVNDRSCVIIS